jgi:NADH:ubiquinone oxidoreductase subunit 6 (subunit J)
MLDLRLPIGILFVIFGVLLIGYGFFVPTQTQIGQSSVDLNICWGAVMGLFGLVMTMLAVCQKKTEAS